LEKSSNIEISESQTISLLGPNSFGKEYWAFPCSVETGQRFQS